MKTSIRSATLLAALAALTLTAAPASAQMNSGKPIVKAAAKHETQAHLKAEAKISAADAKKTALAKVPGGWVKSSELEREEGKLIYSFDIATKGKPGIDEVWVDAITGQVVGDVKHETPKMEKVEAKADAKEHRAAAKAAKHDMKEMQHDMKHDAKEMKKP